jgi:coenzyme F420-reducing hydrogenase beta subunit
MSDLFSQSEQYVFGGYHKNENIRFQSTSGGAFSAIIDTYCNENYAIFGAEADGLNVFHSYILDKNELKKFQKSKYSQSKMGMSYKNVKNFLMEGKKVLFSGTPCQIAGLRSYLQVTKVDTKNLLTVEVVCEGVPSPLYIRKMEKELEKKYGSKIESLDYRYTGKSIFNNGKWDFQIMRVTFQGNKKELKRDRWFNPFWSIWIAHLMSRPSCYECPYARKERVADITLGDLWGVHLYCPELYGKNSGASLIIANTKKGKEIVQSSINLLEGHELKIEDALKYQGPMRKSIGKNENRKAFMEDLKNNDLSYSDLNRKWAAKTSLKLLYQKYIWGNRQKIALWNITSGKYKIK